MDVTTFENQRASLGTSSTTAGQSSKRLRSNSDEASLSKLSQVLAWLPRASSSDVEKIWQFLKASMDLSNTSSWLDIDETRPTVPAKDIAKATLGIQERYPAVCTPIDCFMLEMNPAQDWMGSQGFAPNPTDTLMVAHPSMQSNFVALDSMPLAHESYSTQLPSHQVPPFADSAAAMAAANLLLPSAATTSQDTSRESLLSNSSYSSLNTSSRFHSQHSSINSLDSLASQRPKTARKSHRRSSSLGKVPHAPAEISFPCSQPDCTTTCKRDSDRIRHESDIHGTDIWTCLLDTCNSACAEFCQEGDHHIRPFQVSRADKMKKHLDKVHGWNVSRGEIPEAFLKSFKRQQRGWLCACGTFLGSWLDNKAGITYHSETCADLLQNSLKKMSFGDLGVRAKKESRKPSLDKELPRLFGNEDEEWMKRCLEDGILH